MEQEIEQVVQAIIIASDPTQSALHQQALGYLATIQQNANETWRLALPLFVQKGPDGLRKYPTQGRFFALRVLDEFFDYRFERFDETTFRTIQQELVSYIQSEYINGPAESNASFLRNKFSHTLTLFFLCTYVDQWPTFFSDLFTLIKPSNPASPSIFNRHISLLFFHIVLEISGEVADQIIKAARPFDAERHARDGFVRDAVRERDAASINEAVLTLVAEGTERMEHLRKQELTPETKKELDGAIEVVDWGVRTFGSYVGWIDINLTVTPTTIPLLFNLLADPSLPIRLATSVALLRIVAKGLKEPSDKLSLFKVLSLGEVLGALETKTREQQEERGENTDEAEESYREALGKLFNTYGLELAKLIDECPDEDIRSQATNMMTQLLPILLRFLADVYDDTCSTVFPMLQVILTGYKRARKMSTGPIDDGRRSFLVSLLEVLLIKMKWDEEGDPEDLDDDDTAEFEKMRKELRTFIDSITAIDPNLVTEAVRTLSLNTISAYQNGTQLNWNDVELGIYLVYIFGEINKSGGKGRAAFCQAPADREKRKGIDYAEYPLTTLGEMLYALVQSKIVLYPHRAVTLQYFETVSRYPDFFKIRKECIIPTLEAMAGGRGLHNENPTFRLRVFYLFQRFIKEVRADLPTDFVPGIVESIRDLLVINVELPTDQDDSEEDLLSEALKSSTFDSQLYLFETAGILCSTLFKSQEQSSSLLLLLVKPLMDELSVNLQASQAKGGQDVIPIVKVHHIIMALGNISKGFPDYPATPTENYIPPPLNVFAEVAQAILVCLENMNIFKAVREAASTDCVFKLYIYSFTFQTRFAFARILATAGPSVTHFIPPLMANLLAHFEPSELVDFMNLIGLLIHKLQQDMFDVLDQLIGPLSTHIASTLSQPPSGTDDERSHMETKRSYLALLNNIMANKLQGVFISERNSGNFESLLDKLRQQAEDVSDPPNQKIALTFLIKAINIWGQSANVDGQNGPSNGLPGFEHFIYKSLVPSAFRVPSAAGFSLKDGQMMMVLHEIANLLQAVCQARGPEAYDFFLAAYLPSQGWPQEAALEFTTKMRDLDGKSFRKYFTDFVRSSGSS